MSKVSDYQIVQAIGIETLARKVLDLTIKGWIPQGGPLFAEGRYLQAMILR